MALNAEEVSNNTRNKIEINRKIHKKMLKINIVVFIAKTLF
tara:strand:+ start:8956 stop:9078 length:123 start_codon:yes stop_codon:yes gene_type:complete